MYVLEIFDEKLLFLLFFGEGFLFFEVFFNERVIFFEEKVELFIDFLFKGFDVLIFFFDLLDLNKTG
jgi:hypothetical protein